MAKAKKKTRKRTVKATPEARAKAAADVVMDHLKEAGFTPNPPLRIVLAGIIAIGMAEGRDVAIHHLGGLASKNPGPHDAVYMAHSPYAGGGITKLGVVAQAKTIHKKPAMWAMVVALVGAVIDAME